MGVDFASGEVVLDVTAMPARVAPEEGPPAGVVQSPPSAGVWTSGLQRAAEQVIVVLCHSPLR